MNFEEYKKRAEEEDKPLERPLIDPIDLAGGALGSIAAKGLLGLGRAAATEGASAIGGAASKLKGMLGKSTAKQAIDEITPTVSGDVTRTASMGNSLPLTEEELTTGAIKASPNLNDLSGKNIEFNTDSMGNTLNKFTNGNLPGSNGSGARQLIDPPRSIENGNAIMQGIRDKIAQANQTAYGSPQVSALQRMARGQ